MIPFDQAVSQWAWALLDDIGRIADLPPGMQPAMHKLVVLSLTGAHAEGMRHAAALLAGWGRGDLCKRLETAIHERGKP